MAIIGKKYRTQILFEPKQHDALKKIAQKENCSVSHVVREIVQAYFVERSDNAYLQQQLDALSEVKRHRAEILARRSGKPLDIEISDWIGEMREERDNELFDSALSSGD